MRHEILSIHVANHPQFYPECAHLNISGTGTAFPSERYMARFPGTYVDGGTSPLPLLCGNMERAGEHGSRTNRARADPSIFIDIYADDMKDVTVSLGSDRTYLCFLITDLAIELHSGWSSGVGWVSEAGDTRQGGVLTTSQVFEQVLPGLLIG